MPFPFEETAVRTVFTAISHASFLKPIVVFVGSVLPWVIALWFVVTVFRIKSFKLKFYYFALATIAIIISRGIITEMLYSLFYSPRPFEFFGISPVISHALKSGMPSGHMAWLVPIAFSFLSMRRRTGIVAASLVALVGIARIIGGVHWPSDIVIGIVVGIVGFVVARAILPAKLSVEHLKKAEIDEEKNSV
ncbi:MAG: phosphatase PAP2 family protein [Parcubacteria group bacterium]